MSVTSRELRREPWFAPLVAALQSTPLIARLALSAGLVAPLSIALVPAPDLFARAVISASAYVGLTASILAWAPADGRTRNVRGWIVVAFAIWCALQAFENLEHFASPPIPADLLLVAIAIAAAGAYHADLAGRMPLREQLAVYLDAAVVTAMVSVALIVLFGERALADPLVAKGLLYAIVFGGILSATAILDLTVLAELRPRGAYVLLAGIAVVSVAYVARAGGAPQGDVAQAILVSAGALLVAFGTVTWSDRADTSARYAEIAARLRNVLPLAAAVVTPLIVVLPIAGNDAIESLARLLTGLALFGVVVRQSLLLGEREGMLGDVAAAGAAAERRTQQIAGLEAVGRLLATTGPTYDVLNQVVNVIHERFGYAHVAIYLTDGELLRLGAQRGYSDLFSVLDKSRGIIGRVTRNQRAELVADVTRDPDYLMTDARMRSEICAPLLDSGEFLGVLAVESSGADPLDETDLAAVVAVADQLAAATALAVRRQRLLHESNFTSALLDTVASLIVVTDPRGHVVRFNPMCAEVSGYSIEELRARESFVFLVPPEQRTSVEALVHEVQTAGSARTTENDWIRKDGSSRRIIWSNRPVFDQDGRVEYVLATGIDITDRKRLEEQLAHRALHDPLTGLPNRALLMDRLDQALRRRRGKFIVGVLFIDLDDFKVINDTLGHEAGDRALMLISERLKVSLRPEDTAARVGGDEFAVVLEGLRDADEATVIADRVRNALSGYEMAVGGTKLRIDASIGVTTTGRSRTDTNDLLRNADIAMYAAKTAGGGRYEVFRPRMYASVIERRQLERELVEAVEQQEFVLHFQPILGLADGRVVGSEALVRWKHPQRGQVAPGEFLEVAEATGLIVPIGAQVLRQAALQMARWRASDRPAPDWISVNVSARQLEDPSLLDHVRDALDVAALDPGCLVLEITESLMLDASHGTASTLQRLEDLGVRFALDDFGTGYSSLSYLRRLPVELLKIDRSFVAGVDSEPQQAAFVGALVAMGRTLGLRVVAEGIETAAQHRALKALGCELGQGFYLGRPAPETGSAPPAEPADLSRRVAPRRRRALREGAAA